MLEEMSNRYGHTMQQAVDLADSFEEHAQYISGIAYLSEHGYEIVSAQYGEVVPELRASVFNDFCKELTRRGIEYDVSEFNK